MTGGDGMSELLELGGSIRRGYSSIIANAGKIIAAITLLVAILITFTDMTFYDLTSEEFTTTLTVMLISAYMMYFSLENAGEREGEHTEQYKAAHERYSRARGEITPDCIDSLRSFCLDYSRRELEYRRLCYLGERGYSAADLAAYKRGEKFTAKASRCFRRAERMKALKLSPTVLTSGSRIGDRRELANPIGRRIFDALTSLIPSTLCMIFTVSVILTAKENMSLSTVIDGIVKLSALPIVGFKGMLDGYAFTKEDKSAWLEAKAGILESFINENAPSPAVE